MDQVFCGQGCQDCILDQVSSKYKCATCINDFILDKDSGICIYSKCLQGLYKKNVNDNSTECVAICDNLKVGNIKSKTCDNIDQCTAFVSNSNQLRLQIPIKDAIKINENTILLIQFDYFTLIKEKGVIYDMIKIDENIIQISRIEDNIFVVTVYYEIYIWDVMKQQKNYLTKLNVTNSVQIYFSVIETKYICTMTINKDKNVIEINSIYNNVAQQTQVDKIGQIVLSSNSHVQIIFDMLIIKNSSQLIVNQIHYSNSFSISNPIQCPYIQVEDFFEVILDFKNKVEYLIGISNQILYYINLNQQICKQINLGMSNDLKINFINASSLINKSSLLTVQNKEYLFIYDCANFQQIQKIQIPFENESYIGVNKIDIINQTSKLIAFTNKNKLLIFTYQNNQYILTKVLKNIISDIYNIIKVVDYKSQNNNEYTQIILQSQFMLQLVSINSDQSVKYNQIKNYELPFQISPGNVKQMLLFESQSLLITCLSSGYILFYDISGGFEAIVIRKIYYPEEQCIQIESVQQKYIFALFSQRVIQLNLFSGEIMYENKIIDQLTKIKGISVNGIYSLIYINDCILIIENNSYSQVFKNCNETQFQNIQFINLDNQFKLLAQTENSVFILQLDIQQTQQTFKILKSKSFVNKINYFNVITQHLSNNIQFDHAIEELLVFDNSNNFYILNNENLEVIHQMNIPQIKYPSEIKRVKNDNQIYVMIQTTQNQSQFMHNLLAIQKGVTDGPIWSTIGFEYSPYIDTPVKIVSENKKEYYLIRQYLILGFVTVIKDLLFNLEKSVNYVYGHDFIVGESYFKSIRIQDPLDSRQLSYIGSNTGTICFQNTDYKRYQVLSIKQYFKSDTEDIVDLLQSSKIGKYFIQTTQQILILNIHTDYLENQISLNEKEKEFQIKMSILDEIKGIIYFNSVQLNLTTYINNQANNYTYNKLSFINDWQYISQDNQIYVYGDGLVILDINLNVNKTVLEQNKYNIFQCLFNENNFVCAFNKIKLLIYDFQSQSISNTIEINGFSQTGFFMQADIEYSRFFILQNSIQIYSITGTFIMNFQFSFKNYHRSTIQDQYFIVFSLTSIINRSDISLYAEFQSPSGFHILNFLYISQKKYIAYFCNNSIYSQIYIIDIPAKGVVGKISQNFPKNGNGIVVNLFYDVVSNNIVYIDDLGSINAIILNGEYTQQGNTKILEIAENNEKPIGFQLDFNFANILVYSKRNLYKVNYNLMSDKYQILRKTVKQMFASINIALNNSNVITQILILNSYNQIFRYDEFQLIFEANFSDEIIEMKYSQNNKTLIVAFKNYFLYQSNYVYGNISSFDNMKKFEIDKFYKLIDDDVFLTDLGHLIHFNYTSNTIIKEIIYPQNSIITCTYLHSNQIFIIIGFNDGNILIYSKKSYQPEYLNQIQNLQTTNIKKSIKYIIELNPSILMIVSIQGQILEIDIDSFQEIRRYTLQSKIKEQDTKQIFLNAFVFDLQYSRLIFQFFGNKYGYVWNKDKDFLEGYINSGNNQNNHITLSDIYIISSSSHQLNFYSRKGEFKFIGSITGSNFFVEVTEFIVLNINYVFICSLDKLRVYYFSDSEVRLLNTQNLNNPMIIKNLFNENQQTITVIGLSDKGIFESSIVVQNNSNKNSIICGKEIKTDELTLIKQQILMIEKPKELRIGNGLKLQEQSSVYLFVDIQSQNINLLNKIINQSNIQGQTSIVFSEQNNNSNYEINSNTFSPLGLTYWYIKNINLQFEQIDQSINLRSNSKYINMQNVTVENNKHLRSIKLNYINLEEVIFFNLTIQSNQYPQNNIKTDMEYFLYFENVTRIYIYNLTIQRNNFSTLNLQKELIYMNSVSQIIIENINITKNINIGSIFRFDNIQSLKIKNVQIYQNQNTISYKDNSTLYYIFSIYSCQNVCFKFIDMRNNLNYSMVISTNVYTQVNQIVTKQDDILKIKNSTIQNNTNENNSIINLRSSFVLFKELNYLYNKGNIKIQRAINTTIVNCTLHHNEYLNGGALYILRVSQVLFIKNTSITNNTAYGSGGGIYIEDPTTNNIKIINDTIIQFNKALIGGGLRILNKNFKTPLPLDYPFKSIVIKNTADIYGNNSCSNVTGINIMNNQQAMKNNNHSQIQQINYQFNFIQKEWLNLTNTTQSTGEVQGILQVDQFKSGGKLFLNFFLVDDNNQSVIFSKQKLLNNEYPVEVADELKYLSIIIMNDSKDISLVGQTIVNYNVYNDNLKCFQLEELQISAAPQKFKQLTILSNTNKFSQTQINLQLNIQFRKCITGEVIFDVSESIQTCYFCQEGSYSLNEPLFLYEQSQNPDNTTQKNNQKVIANLCKKCPDSAFYCEGNLIQLLDGYWRKDDQSDEIIACSKQYDSCVGESDPSGKKICAEGYIGPLCEECDISGIEWRTKDNGRYVSSFYIRDCKLCSKDGYQYSFLGFQITLVLLYLVYNTKRFILNFTFVQTCYYLRSMRFLPISKQPLQSQSTSIIKILLTYIQFTALFVSYSSLLPIQIHLIPNLLGSSNQMIVLNISCIIPKELFAKYGKLFVFSVLNTIIPIVFMILCSFVLLIFNFFEFQKHLQKYVFHTFVNVVYMFFLSDNIQYFTQMLTCRKIGNINYHSADLMKSCDDPEIQRLLIPYSASMLVIWTLLPLLNLYRLSKLSNKLELCIVKFKFGYFYQELTNKFYFWEFVRIYLKILIVFLYTLLKRQNIILAHQMVIIIFMYYVKMVQTKKPFIQQKLNFMEIFSIQILVIKIVISQLKQEYEILSVYLDTFIYFLDLIILMYFIKNIFMVTASNQSSKFGRLAKKLCWIFCSKIYYKKFKQRINVQFQSYNRWKKISKNLKKVIISEASQNVKAYQKKQRQQDENESIRKRQISYNNNIVNTISPVYNYENTQCNDISFSFRDSPQLQDTLPPTRQSLYYIPKKKKPSQYSMNTINNTNFSTSGYNNQKFDEQVL